MGKSGLWITSLSVLVCLVVTSPVSANNHSPQAMQEFWRKHQSRLSTDPQLRQQFDQLCQQKDCDLSLLIHLR